MTDQQLPTIQTKTSGLNRVNFKLLLMLLMVLDHIQFFISPYLADSFHLITRVVAVGFGYLLVEGMHYTHSRKQYLFRLFGFSLLMSTGNFLLNTFFLQPAQQLSILGDNIFLTLALGATIITLWDNVAVQPKKQMLLKIGAILLAILSVFPFTEGSFLVIPFILLTQLTYGYPRRRDFCYILLALLLAIIEIPLAVVAGNGNPLMIFDSIAMNASEPFFILIIPLLHYYNGNLSPLGQKFKYVFYIFYPAHLWLIHIIANAL